MGAPDAPDTLPADFFSKKKQTAQGDDAPDTLPADFFAQKSQAAPKPQKQDEGNNYVVPLLQMLSGQEPGMVGSAQETDEDKNAREQALKIQDPTARAKALDDVENQREVRGLANLGQPKVAPGEDLANKELAKQGLGATTPLTPLNAFQKKRAQELQQSDIPGEVSHEEFEKAAQKGEATLKQHPVEALGRAVSTTMPDGGGSLVPGGINPVTQVESPFKYAKHVYQTAASDTPEEALQHAGEAAGDVGDALQFLNLTPLAGGGIKSLVNMTAAQEGTTEAVKGLAHLFGFSPEASNVAGELGGLLAGPIAGIRSVREANARGPAFEQFFERSRRVLDRNGYDVPDNVLRSALMKVADGQSSGELKRAHADLKNADVQKGLLEHFSNFAPQEGMQVNDRRGQDKGETHVLEGQSPDLQGAEFLLNGKQEGFDPEAQRQADELARVKEEQAKEAEQQPLKVNDLRGQEKAESSAPLNLEGKSPDLQGGEFIVGDNGNHVTIGGKQHEVIAHNVDGKPIIDIASPIQGERVATQTPEGRTILNAQDDAARERQHAEQKNEPFTVNDQRNRASIEEAAKNAPDTMTPEEMRAAKAASSTPAEPAADRRGDAREGSVDRRADVEKRKRVSEMTPDEMKRELLTSPTTGLPNRRAFDEAPDQGAVGMSDADGLKALNDKYGYEAGNALLKAKADALREAGLDAFHDKGDEFLLRGKSPEEIAQKLENARNILRNRVIALESNGETKYFKGADFSYGTGKDAAAAESGLKQHKATREAAGERARGELRGITEVRPEDGQQHQSSPQVNERRPRIAEAQQPQQSSPSSFPINDRRGTSNGEVAQVIGEQPKDVKLETPGTKPNPDATVVSPEEATRKPSQNSIFTEERYNAAKKVWARAAAGGQLNANPLANPELYKALVDTVGYHIERGVRDLATITKAVTDEFGEKAAEYVGRAYDEAQRMIKNVRVSGTNERVKPLTFNEAEQRRDTPEFHNFLQKTHQAASELGVTITEQRPSAGVFEGNWEPSTTFEVTGTQNAVDALAARIGLISKEQGIGDGGAQDQVLRFTLNNSKAADLEFTLGGVTDPEAVQKAFLDADISGGRIENGKFITISFDGNAGEQAGSNGTIREVANRLGLTVEKTVPGNSYFIPKEKYDEAIGTDAATKADDNGSGHRQTGSEPTTPSGDSTGASQERSAAPSAGDRGREFANQNEANVEQPNTVNAADASTGRVDESGLRGTGSSSPAHEADSSSSESGQSENAKGLGPRRLLKRDNSERGSFSLKPAEDRKRVNLFEGKKKPERSRPDNFAGSVNLDYLNTPADVKTLIKKTAEENRDNFNENRRGVVPMAKTEKAADQLIKAGWNADDIAKLKSGKTLNAEELTAAGKLTVQQAENVQNMMRKATESGKQEDMLRALAAYHDYAAVQRGLDGATTEVARALNSKKIILKAAADISNGDNRVKALDTLRDALGDKWEKNADKLFTKVMQFSPDDKVGLAQFMRNSVRPSFGNLINSYYTANLLSGPRTPAKKFLGDIAIGATMPIRRTFRGVLDPAIAAMTGKERTYYLSEVPTALKGYVHGMAEGWQKAAFMMKNGFEPAEADNLEGPSGVRELPGGLKNPLNYSPRVLKAVTTMFQTMAYNGELHAQAVRAAIKEGHTGDALQSRYEELVNAPTPEMVKAAEKQMKYETFTDDPDAFARAAYSLQNAVTIPEHVPLVGGAQPLRFVIPFVKVPWNFFKRGAEHTPLGLAELGKEGAITGKSTEVLTDVAAKQLMGASLMTLAAVAASYGRLTGAAPKDKKERALFFDSGKQEYSIKVGNHWVSYNKTPFGLPMSMVAAYYDDFNKKGDVPTSDRIINSLATVGKAIKDESFLSGISALTDMWEDPQHKTAQFVGQTASGFIPMSSALRQTEHAVDNKVRDAQSIGDKVQAGIPGLAQKLPTKLDSLGRDIERKGDSGLGAFAPVTVSEATAKSPLDAELARLDVEPGTVSNHLRIGNQKIDLSREQAHAFEQQTGTLIRQQLERLVNSGGYKNASDENKVELLKDAIQSARRVAKNKFISANPDFRKLKRPLSPLNNPNL